MRGSTRCRRTTVMARVFGAGDAVAAPSPPVPAHPAAIAAEARSGRTVQSARRIGEVSY
jgi:hypothetical protein